MAAKKLRIQVFLQMRLNSARLFQKALLKLNEFTILETTLQGLRKTNIDRFVLLTTENDALNPTVRRLCEKYAFHIFTGPEDDVLQRFCSGLEAYPSDYIIRSTADNPLLAPELINYLSRVASEYESSNKIVDYSFIRGLARGLGSELVYSQSLEHINRLSLDKYYREHVNPYIYENKTKFNVLYHAADKINRHWAASSKYELSIDTPADYKYMKSLFAQNKNIRDLNIEELLQVLTKQQLAN